VANIHEIEPVIKDEHEKPESDEEINVEEENGEEGQEWPETPDFSDIPFEIKRPPKDAPDPTQMTLF
jgi:hypothetical protein